jgi:hypothetical protein
VDFSACQDENRYLAPAGAEFQGGSSTLESANHYTLGKKFLEEWIYTDDRYDGNNNRAIFDELSKCVVIIRQGRYGMEEPDRLEGLIKILRLNFVYVKTKPFFNYLPVINTGMSCAKSRVDMKIVGQYFFYFQVPGGIGALFRIRTTL